MLALHMSLEASLHNVNVCGVLCADLCALLAVSASLADLNKWEEISPGPTLARGSCTFAAS
jgi:hypothetical protein